MTIATTRRGLLAAAGIGPIAGRALLDGEAVAGDPVRVDGPDRLAAALTWAGPGATVLLEDGVYPGAHRLDRAGARDRPVAIGAAHPLGATLTGSLTVAADDTLVRDLAFAPGARLVAAGNRLRILRCRFDGGPAEDDSVTLEIVRGAEVEIGWCEFVRIARRGVSVKPSRGVRYPWIHHNRFRDFLGVPGTNVHEPIQLGQGPADTMLSLRALVELNLLDNCNVDDEAISIKSSGNLVRLNTLLASPLASIHNRSGRNNRVLANWIEGSGGIRVMDRGTLLLGNRVDGSGRIEIFAGNREAGEPLGRPPRYYPAARDTRLAGNEGPVVVGRLYASARPPMDVPASATLIEAHDGPISYEREIDTKVRRETDLVIPVAIRLAADQVGPAAR